jgi:hypothetical protein
LIEYRDWVSGGNIKEILDSLKEASLLLKSGGENHLGYQELRSQGASGFFITAESGLEPKEYFFLMDYFKEKLEEAGYRSYSSVRKSKDTEIGVKYIEKHYLKPERKKNESGKIIQQFGNITLTTEFMEGNPDVFKLLTNTHTGYHYEDPINFDELLTFLFS